MAKNENATEQEFRWFGPFTKKVIIIAAAVVIVNFFIELLHLFN